MGNKPAFILLKLSFQENSWKGCSHYPVHFFFFPSQSSHCYLLFIESFLVSNDLTCQISNGRNTLVLLLWLISNIGHSLPASLLWNTFHFIFMVVSLDFPSLVGLYSWFLIGSFHLSCLYILHSSKVQLWDVYLYS